jgi:hypothetical protein
LSLPPNVVGSGEGFPKLEAPKEEDGDSEARDPAIRYESNVDVRSDLMGAGWNGSLKIRSAAGRFCEGEPSPQPRGGGNNKEERKMLSPLDR